MNTSHTELLDYGWGLSSLGLILVAGSDTAICATLVGDDRSSLLNELQQSFPAARIRQDDGRLATRIGKVIRCLEQPQELSALPVLEMRGTEFQRRVWSALQHIPVGSTVSYSALAEQIGAPAAVRAVAGACAANKLAVLVPCHRVVRSNGELSGYRWGVQRKQFLLQRERQWVKEAG